MPVVERVSAEDGLARVKDLLGSDLKDARVDRGHLSLTCAPDRLVRVMETLRDAEGLRCRFFTFLSAVDRSEFTDRPEEMPEFELLVHVYAPDHALHVNVHVPLDLAKPVCPSISGVYAGALWHEREALDMFGIRFEGHPNLVRLYLPEDFEGHPGLRSFKLPGRATVKDWPGAKDPEEAAAGGR